MFFTNLKNRVDVISSRSARTRDKIEALEDYLGIEYFNGPKYKPHYRKRKVIAKKMGRPRKNK